jgi:hypothetical protein
MASGDADLSHPEELPVLPPQPSEAPADQPSTAGVPPLGPFADVPPLSLLAALAALTWVSVHRLVLPLLASRKVMAPTVLVLMAPFALNVTAVAGIVALSYCAFDLVRSRELTFPGRRIVIGGLAALLLSTLGVATFLPEGHMSAQHVLVAAGALHMLVVQVSMTTLRLEHSLAGRTTNFLLAASSLFALAPMLLRHVPSLSQSSWASEGIASLHGLGELSFLLTPTAGAFVVLPFMAVLFSAAARIPDALYGHLLYSTLRLEWALERASLGYAIPISLAVGAATAASVGRDSRHRQGGAGLWLWLVGGYNPLTPARILVTALGAVLLCRAILSLGETSQTTSEPR